MSDNNNHYEEEGKMIGMYNVEPFQKPQKMKKDDNGTNKYKRDKLKARRQKRHDKRRGRWDD